MDEDYTARDVAEKLRRAPDTIAALCRAGKIPGAYQLAAGSPWSIRRGEFDAWHKRLTGQYTPREHDRLEPPSTTSRRRIGASR